MKKNKKEKSYKDKILGLNPYLLFLPFLFLYIAIILAFSKNAFQGDEGRYIFFAKNLLHGYYSPPPPDINLWNGPGYPLLIAPFMFFKLPLIVLRLFNGLLLYLSLIISYKTVSMYSSKKSAFLSTILLGLYFPIFQMLPLILTEVLTWFLITLLCFLFAKSFNKKIISWKLLFLTTFLLAFLAMTKVIFGYVILSMIFVSIFMLVFPQFRSSAKKSTLIFLLSFVFCLPWLLYTYNLTNNFFYWTNSGSMSLYTMSTPYENELGDWSSSVELNLNPNHKVFIDSISNLNALQRDKAFKKKAIENIYNHPKKYFSNWTANIGRLVFSYPYSYGEQTIKTYFTIIPNMFVIVFILLAAVIGIVRYNKLPIELILLLLFILIYLFGSSLVSAYRRMFYITIPFWILFLSYVFTNLITIKFRKK